MLLTPSLAIKSRKCPWIVTRFNHSVKGSGLHLYFDPWIHGLHSSCFCGLFPSSSVRHLRFNLLKQVTRDNGSKQPTVVYYYNAVACFPLRLTKCNEGSLRLHSSSIANSETLHNFIGINVVLLKDEMFCSPDLPLAKKKLHTIENTLELSIVFQAVCAKYLV